MKKWIYSTAVLFGAILLFVGAIVSTSNKGSKSVGTNTYADSQTDTVKWTRESGVNALAFGYYANDTVEVTTARVQRVVNGKPAQQGAITAGDTLTNLTALDQTTAANIALGITTLDAITLAPVADEYWVIVQYASSGNGVAGTACRYEFIKSYAK